MTDQELELAILQRYIEHHDAVGTQAQKCARELDMKNVISTAIGRPVEETVVRQWHARLGRQRGPLTRDTMPPMADNSGSDATGQEIK
jgi:hypothetical protein